MITQVFRVIFFIIGAVAVLFTGNAFLGSDRLWNYIDYSAISEQAQSTVLVKLRCVCPPK